LCGRALEQVQAALQLRPHDGGLHFLRGQIHLKARQLDAASDALEAACRCGVDMRQAAPLLAEIAFRKRRYADVKHHLKRAGRRKAAPTLRSASTYWDGV
jgi:cytochrome c-type biogenesis protein CcmH/NrfG